VQLLKSHKNKLYIDHLNEILEVCFYLLDLLNPPKKEEYKEILLYITFYHDIFKLTKEFQDYLNDIKAKKPITKHAELSGLLLYLNKDLLPNKYKDIIITTCLSHHTFPKIVDPMKFEEYKYSLNQLPKFIEEIREYMKLLNFRNDKLEKIKEDFLRKELSTEFQIISSLVSNIKEKHTIEEYLDFLYIYAIFTIADRISASFESGNFKGYYQSIIKNLIDIKEICEKDLLDYLNELSKKENDINKLRSIARREALENLKGNENEKVFILELPTGLGKTLTSLQIALKIRNNKPIIYSLPFLSIIEQTQKVFSTIYGDRVSTLHHIAPLEINEEDSEIFSNSFSTATKKMYEKDSEKDFIEKFLLPYKIKDLTITTHERLRRTLFPSSRNDILLFPFLVNAVWVIDEIQLYPLCELYPLSRLIEQISKQFNTKFIIMSATVPTLKFETVKAVELIKDRKNYYLDRYKIEKFGEKDYEKIYNKVMKLIGEGKSVGILVNTVRESLELYKYFLNQIEKEYTIEELEPYGEDSLIIKILKNPFIYDEIKEILKGNKLLDPKLLIRKIILDGSEIYLIFLNGKIPSLYKKRVLEILNKIKYKKQLLVVSTQSLEAGVDIDLDVIFREIDTLDSIVQTAGRVNRNNNRDKGTIFLMYPGKNIQYFRIVRGIDYSWIEKFIDRNSLWHKEERELYNIIKEWYEFLMKYVIPKDKKRFLELIEKFDFRKIRESYKSATKEYVLCEGVKIEETLKNKLKEKPRKYEERLKFMKQFSMNSRILFLYKVEAFGNEEDLLNEIEDLLDHECFY